MPVPMRGRVVFQVSDRDRTADTVSISVMVNLVFCFSCVRLDEVLAPLVEWSV